MLPGVAFDIAVGNERTGLPFPFVRSGLAHLVPYRIIKKTEGPNRPVQPPERIAVTDAGHEGTRLCGLRDAAQATCAHTEPPDEARVAHEVALVGRARRGDPHEA